MAVGKMLHFQADPNSIRVELTLALPSSADQDAGLAAKFGCDWFKSQRVKTHTVNDHVHLFP